MKQSRCRHFHEEPDYVLALKAAIEIAIRKWWNVWVMEFLSTSLVISQEFREPIRKERRNRLETYSMHPGRFLLDSECRIESR